MSKLKFELLKHSLEQLLHTEKESVFLLLIK